MSQVYTVTTTVSTPSAGVALTDLGIRDAITHPNTVDLTALGLKPGEILSSVQLQSAVSSGYLVLQLNGVTIQNVSITNENTSALAALSGTGFITRSATGSFFQRTIVAGSSKASITNGDGTAGNPTIDIIESNILVQDLGGVLPISKGGTGQTTASAAFDSLSPLTTKGDIITRDSSSNIRLPVGTNNHVLTADSAQPSGLIWRNPGKHITLAFGSNTTAFFSTISTTPVVVRRFIFPGSSVIGTPTAIYATGNNGNNGTRGFTVTVQNITPPNVGTVATGTFTNNTEAILTLGTISNIPTGQAIFEITLNRSTGSAITVQLSSIRIVF